MKNIFTINLNNRGVRYESEEPIVRVQTDSNVTEMQEVKSAEIEAFQGVEYKEILTKLSQLKILNSLSSICFIFLLFCPIKPALILLPIIGLVLKVLIYTTWRVSLIYNFQDGYETDYKNRVDAWLRLNKSKELMQKVQSGKVKNTKLTAGMSESFKWEKIKISSGKPAYIHTNVKVVRINLKRETLYILPDKILIEKNGKLGAVDYSKTMINVSRDEVKNGDCHIPSDTSVSRYSWQYVNRDGSPDKRFKDNKKVPICWYGGIYIQSPEGLNVKIFASNVDLAMELALAMRQEY